MHNKVKWKIYQMAHTKDPKYCFQEITSALCDNLNLVTIQVVTWVLCTNNQQLLTENEFPNVKL